VRTTKTHYKFANELYLAVLHPGHSEKGFTSEHVEKLLAITQRMAALMPALNLIDQILGIYADLKGLL
jgi:hypothetical protein